MAQSPPTITIKIFQIIEVRKMARRTIGEGEITMSVNLFSDDDEIEEAKKTLFSFKFSYENIDYVPNIDRFTTDLQDVVQVFSTYGDVIDNNKSFRNAFVNLSLIVRNVENGNTCVIRGFDNVFKPLPDKFRIVSVSANGDFNDVH